MSLLARLFKSADSNFPPDMKYLIVGLGNPGVQYRHNRHNIGFMVLDALAETMEAEFETTRLGTACKVKTRGKSLLLLKPNTFMNLSGKAVRHHLQAEKIPESNLLVVTDDIALPFGKIRIRQGGSHGGHNGLRNIQELLGHNKFARMRFGVGDDFPRGGQANYVLADFPEMEQAELPDYISRMGEAILTFAGQGIDQAMNKFNG